MKFKTIISLLVIAIMLCPATLAEEGYDSQVVFSEEGGDIHTDYAIAFEESAEPNSSNTVSEVVDADAHGSDTTDGDAENAADPAGDNAADPSANNASDPGVEENTDSDQEITAELVDEVVMETSDVDLSEAMEGIDSVENEEMLDTNGELLLVEDSVLPEEEDSASSDAMYAATSSYNTGDDYPYKSYCSGCHNTNNGDDHTDYSPMRYYYRQCTDFAAWCLRSRNGVTNFGYNYGGATWGNAKSWKGAAESLGIACNSTPAIGAIACWTSGTYGHVAWVKAISGSKVIIEEYNYANASAYGWREIDINNPTCYIHVADIDTIAPVITNARIENRTASGYDVVVCASDDTGISWVQIGTWHSAMSIDNAVWQDTKAIINGKATIHVNYSSFGNPSNVIYYTNAFAADSFGNVSEGTRCVPIEDLGDDFYATIVQESSNAYLQNQGNKVVTGYPTDNASKYIWRFRKQKDGEYIGSYEITSEYNGRCIDITNYGTADGTEINLLERVGNIAQRFYICSVGNNPSRYSLSSVYCRAALDVPGAYTNIGGTVQLWTMNFTDAQIFRISNPFWTIRYDANGGTGAPAEQTKYYATGLTLSFQKPTRTGYTFLGWSTRSDAVQPEYQPGAEYRTDANLKLYAVWFLSEPVLPQNDNSIGQDGGGNSSSGNTSSATGSSNTNPGKSAVVSAPAPAPATPADPITINKTPASIKAKVKKGTVTVSWKKIKKSKKTKALLAQIKSIQVQYSTDPNFATDVNTKTLGKKKTKAILKLQRKTTYYVRVRYVGSDGVSNWGAVKAVKTK